MVNKSAKAALKSGSSFLSLYHNKQNEYLESNFFYQLILKKLRFQYFYDISDFKQEAARLLNWEKHGGHNKYFLILRQLESVLSRTRTETMIQVTLDIYILFCEY